MRHDATRRITDGQYRFDDVGGGSDGRRDSFLSLPELGDRGRC